MCRIVRADVLEMLGRREAGHCDGILRCHRIARPEYPRQVKDGRIARQEPAVLQFVIAQAAFFGRVISMCLVAETEDLPVACDVVRQKDRNELPFIGDVVFPVTDSMARWYTGSPTTGRLSSRSSIRAVKTFV